MGTVFWAPLPPFGPPASAALHAIDAPAEVLGLDAGEAGVEAARRHQLRAGARLPCGVRERGTRGARGMIGWWEGPSVGINRLGGPSRPPARVRFVGGREGAQESPLPPGFFIPFEMLSAPPGKEPP